MSHSDTDGYRILNFRNFRIRIGYGYAKIFSDMDQELKNQYPLTSGMQRSGDARGDCLIGCPPFKLWYFEQCRMVVIVTGYTLSVTPQYDVVFTFANQCFGKVCWHNMHNQERRSSGRGSSKKIRAMETYKKQKNRYQLRLFLFINNVDPKDHNRIIENHSEFSGCPNSCSEFVSSRPW